MQEKIKQLVDELTEKFEKINTMQELNDLKAQYQRKESLQNLVVRLRISQ